MEESEKLRKDAEDIEPVELEEVHESFDDAEIVLNDPHIRCIVQNQRESTIPFLLLDNELNVLHTNHTFVELFGNNPSVTSLSLASIFTSGITPQTMRDIAHSLKSPTSGYSWRGRVETHTKNRLPIVANLIIHPLYGETGKLQGYEGIVDNITEENRELLRSTFV
ncbi:MAG TPA: PAS domain-containing protein, partial [Spirochaetia bacterium]|nr:PAS domain-containing protein [Spirochaetia bacterium]